MELTASGDDRLHPALAQDTTMLAVVVGAVSVEGVGTLPRPATLASDRPDRVDQGLELGDVVAVAARDRDRERHPAGIDDRVVLCACASAIDGRRTGQVPPLRART